MEKEQQITRNEVQAMIEQALGVRRGESGKPDTGEKLEQRPNWRQPGRYFDSAGEAQGAAMGRKVDIERIHEQAKERLKKLQAGEDVPLPVPETAEPQPTPKPSGVIGSGGHIKNIVGGGERETTIGREDPRGLGRATGSRGREPFTERAKRVVDPELKPEPESIKGKNDPVTEAIIIVMNAVEQRFISRQEVEAKINAAVPEAIRNMGRTSAPGIGEFLKREKGCRTATWGLCDSSNSSSFPSNANKSKWMVPTMSADNATVTDDPALWTVGWIRAHA